LSRAALHAGEHILRYVGEIPAAICDGSLVEGLLKLPLVSFEESGHLPGQLVAEAAEFGRLLCLDDRKVRFVVTLCGVGFLRLGGAAQKFALEHVAHMRVYARRGETERIGDL